MSGAVRVRTPGLRLAILNFAFPNWGDDANKNMRILDAAFSAFGIAITGAWENGTEYPAGSVVVDTVSNELYRASVAHISSIDGTFADERSTNPLMWDEYSTEATSVGEWQSETTYFQNNIVYFNYVWAIANKRYTSSNAFEQDIADGNLVIIVDLEEVVNTSNANVITTNTNVGLTAGDRVQTGLDRIAASDSASEALGYRNTASIHATTATNKAGEAVISANSADGSANAASGSASAASTSASNAFNSATASETARGLSVIAASNASDAAGDALGYRNAAAGYASTASSQAGIAVQAANDTLDREGEVEGIALAVEGNANAAGISASNAGTSEINAGNSASQALGYRNTASTHASNAGISAGDAEDSADEALQYRNASYLWASEDLDVPVDDGTHQGFSAYHWAKKSEASSSGGIFIVNSKFGHEVTLNAADIGAVPASKADDIDDNTNARHTHSNKAVLDGTTASFTTALQSKLNGVATGATANTGTVTSVAMTVPTGLSVSGAITTSGTFTVSYASGYQGYTTAEASKLSGIAAGAQVNLTVGTTTGTVAAGNDSRITGAVQKAGDTGLIGFQSDEYNHGNLPSSFTPSIANGNFQRGNKDAAKTINAPAAGAYSMQITVTNTSGTGGLTASGFDKVNGVFRADDEAKHILFINMSASAKVLTIVAAS